MSQFSKSKGAWVDMELKEKGSLVCLAIGQTLQLLSKEILLEGNNGEANLGHNKDGCPRHMCHKSKG